MNYYEKAISILEQPLGLAEMRKILVEVAKRHPKILMDAAVRAAVLFDDWRSEAKVLCATGKKVGAIKVCMAETGLPFKEAKETVEGL